MKAQRLVVVLSFIYCLSSLAIVSVYSYRPRRPPQQSVSRLFGLQKSSKPSFPSHPNSNIRPVDIDTTLPPKDTTPGPSSNPSLRNVPIGNGGDERRSMLAPVYDAACRTKLLEIQRSMMQLSLLRTLDDPHVENDLVKLDLIHKAAAIDGILPSEDFDPNSIRGTSMYAGSLLDDWNM